MFSFEEKVIDSTVEKLLNGADYRQEIFNAINTSFLDFTLDFFRKIIDAKLNDREINLDWYKSHFLNEKNIQNIYGTTNKALVIDVAAKNYEKCRFS